LINVFIGLFNLIPLLPFDGGHVVVALLRRCQPAPAGHVRGGGAAGGAVRVDALPRHRESGEHQVTPATSR
jgi:membrane-associated protease RseP (regulator of RpoE activity)